LGDGGGGGSGDEEKKGGHLVGERRFELLIGQFL
jgi:hypothetical protein